MEWQVCTENWRFLVCEDGRVVNVLSGHEATHIYSGSGSLKSKPRVLLWDPEARKSTTYFVSRLVALAFLPNPGGLPNVIHLDGDLSNNHVSNLKWANAIDTMNEPHIHRKCLLKHPRGEQHPRARGVICLETGQHWQTQREAARYFGVRHITSYIYRGIRLFGKWTLRTLPRRSES